MQLVAGSDALLGAEGCLPLLVGGRVAADVDEDEDAAFGFEQGLEGLAALPKAPIRLTSGRASPPC